MKTVKGVGWDNCAIGNGLLSFGLLHKFWIVYDREYFHQPENFSNTLRVFGHQKHRQSQREHGTMRTLCLDSRHVSRMGRHGPRGHQVPSLTPHNTFRRDGHHISRGRQVPSLTPCDTLLPDGRHISMGC